MLRHRRAAILFSIVAAISPGCAYESHTGYRDLDGGCRCLEKITAPIVDGCLWTGALAAKLWADTHSSDCEDGDYSYDSGGKKSSGDQSSGDDSTSSAPQGKPLR